MRSWFQVAGCRLRVASFRVISGKAIILCAALCLLNSFLAQSQEIKVRAKFSSDSIKIGKPIEFYLSVHYPEKLNVLFPDSTFTYSPFEFQKKYYVTTKTKNGISIDSVAYVLASYEVDSIQTLKLPVFVVNAMDCTQVFSNTDTVYFQHLVKSIPDSLTAEKLPLKVNVNYLGVKWQLNYLMLGIIGAILVVAIVLVWIFFGKQIKRYFKLKKLRKRYESFRTQFDDSIHKLKQEFLPKNAEQSLLIWKKYMEELSGIPFTKYTTRELKQVFAENEVSLSLSGIDRMIYGQVALESLDSFQGLKGEAEKLFRKKASETEVSLEAPTPSPLKATITTSSPNQVDPTQLTHADIEHYADLLRNLPCPFCGRTDEKLNGTVLHTVKSFLVITSYQKEPIIACPTTLNEKNNLAILSTFLLGWWGFPWGLIKTPHYIYLNLKEKKKIRSKEPNDVLLSFAYHYAHEIEANKDNTERLKELIRTKKSWWQP